MTGKRPPGPGRGNRVKQGNGQLFAGQSGGPARGAERRVLGGHNKATIAAKAARVEAHLDNLDELAFDGAQPGNTRVAASAAALKQLMPDANARLRAGNADDLTDDELADIIRRSGADAAEAAGDPPVSH